MPCSNDLSLQHVAGIAVSDGTISLHSINLTFKPAARQLSTLFFDGLPDNAPIDGHSRRGIRGVLRKAARQTNSHTATSVFWMGKPASRDSTRDICQLRVAT